MLVRECYAMDSIALYNLYLGDDNPGTSWNDAQIGPFRVRLAEDYRQTVVGLHKPEARTTAVSFDDDRLGGTTRVSFSEKRKGGWVATATATRNGTDRSIFFRDADDHGLADLCALLSFCTGRTVATEESLERYRPWCIGERACLGIEALHAAKNAWSHREAFVDAGLVRSLILYNEAIPLDLLEAMGLMYSSALNVILDKTVARVAGLDDATRDQVKGGIESLLAQCRLDERARASMTARLGSCIDQRSGGLTDKTVELLRTLSIVESSPSSEQLRRIQFVNRVRNALVHKGALPQFSGMSANDSHRVACAIVVGIVPSIIRMAIGGALGFTSRGVGSSSQDPRALRQFFHTGVWRDWPVEVQSFEDWFYSDAAGGMQD